MLELDIAEDVVTNPDHLRAEDIVQAAVIPAKLAHVSSDILGIGNLIMSMTSTWQGPQSPELASLISETRLSRH